MPTRCPYPMHRPDYRGICSACGEVVAEPWFMRRRPEPHELVAEIARRHRVNVPDSVAREIAAALLGYADSAIEVRQSYLREQWSNEQHRNHLRERMRWQLLNEVTKQGRIPAALPTEGIRYLSAPWHIADPDNASEVPAEAVAQGAPYERVEVVLAVQVRTPPVDRAAAVRAGVL